MRETRRPSSPASTSRRRCSSGRAASFPPRPGWRGTCSRCRSRPARSRRRPSVSASATSPTSSSGLRRAPARARPGRARGRARDHPAPRAPRSLLPPLVRPDRAVARPAAEGRRRLHLPAGERPPLPRPGRARGPDGLRRLRATFRTAPSRAGSWRSTSGTPRDQRAGDDPRHTRARPLPRGARGAAGGDRRLPRRDRCRRLARCAERGRQAAAAAARLLLRAGRTSAVRGRGGCGRARAHGHARPRRPDRRRRVPPRPRLGLVGLRPGRRAGDRRLPVRTGVRRAGGDRATRTRSRCSRTPRSASRAARRCSAARHTIRIRPWTRTWSVAA